MEWGLVAAVLLLSGRLPWLTVRRVRMSTRDCRPSRPRCGRSWAPARWRRAWRPRWPLCLCARSPPPPRTAARAPPLFCPPYPRLRSSFLPINLPPSLSTRYTPLGSRGRHVSVVDPLREASQHHDWMAAAQGAAACRRGRVGRPRHRRPHRGTAATIAGAPRRVEQVGVKTDVSPGLPMAVGVGKEGGGGARRGGLALTGSALHGHRTLYPG